MKHFDIGENIAVEADLEQLNKLLSRLTKGKTTTITPRQLRQTMKKSFLITAFDEQSGLTIGMMTLIPSIQPNGCFGNIEDVCVLEDYEGHGLFTKMFSLACDIAKREKITKLRLTSNESRERARAIYEHLGFTYHGETGKFTMPIS